MTKSKGSGLLRRGVYRIVRAIYQPQVTVQWPRETIMQGYHSLPPTPPGYVVRSPVGVSDCESWADLLNRDGGFGHWTPERIRVEMLDRLVNPGAATLILHDGKIVGCSASMDASTRRRKTACGMFLYLERAHRKSGLAEVLTYRSLYLMSTAGYDHVIAITDPWRLNAIALYLGAGGQPEYSSLFSYVQWWRALRKLRPVLERLKRKQQAVSGKSLPQPQSEASAARVPG